MNIPKLHENIPTCDSTLVVAIKSRVIKALHVNYDDGRKIFVAGPEDLIMMDVSNRTGSVLTRLWLRKKEYLR